MSEPGEIFRNYLQYTEATEPPIIYHRWCYISILSAILARKAHVAHGHFRVFPNLYIMLLGEPAARKSTSIKMAKKLLASTGYDTFSADKTSKEKFLLDLEGITDEQLEPSSASGNSRKSSKTYDATTAENLWGTDGAEPREVFIVADEFNEFAGAGNTEFYTTLGNLWDWDNESQPFTQRLKNSRSIQIFQPTISILAGNTPELFARAFPPEAIGSGFLSRLLLIHGERSGRKITFPPPPDAVLGESLRKYLAQLQVFSPGELTVSSEAAAMLDSIYQGAEDMNDIRFKAYTNRRFTQLLKLCTIFTCARFRAQIGVAEVLEANTILSHAEVLMPKAMGEFGKSKNSDVANKIMDVLERATKPMTNHEIWKQVHKDLNSIKDLVDLLGGLVQADKIQVLQKPYPGFLPRKTVRKDPAMVDWSFLSAEERNMI